MLTVREFLGKTDVTSVIINIKVLLLNIANEAGMASEFREFG
jgi:hypothetical protein